MYLISGNITSNVTGNLPVITGNGNIGNITSNFRTLVLIQIVLTDFELGLVQLLHIFVRVGFVRFNFCL